MHMALEAFHETKLTNAFNKAYLVGIFMGDMGLYHVLVQEDFGYILQYYGFVMLTDHQEINPI